MYTAAVVSYFSNNVYGAGRQWVAENPRLAQVTLAAVTSFSLIGLIFRRLHQPDVLPFDNWKVTLGLVSRKQVPIDRENLADLVVQYSPMQLASCLYAYLLQNKVTDAAQEKPESPKEWLNWMTANVTNRDALLPLARDIFPSYIEKDELSADDISTLKIQTWMTSFQEWMTLLGWNTLQMTGNIFQSVRSAPQLAYTILFHFTAPIVGQKIWETIQDPLPESLNRLKEIYLNHQTSIALASLAAVGFLFYRMKQEKGVLKNLTQSWATFQQPHKRYDLIPSYQKGINQVLCSIGRSPPQKKGNIIWYYDQQAHRTFGDEIGEALAEETAAGRIYNAERTVARFPHLQNLQVFELDLEEFLTIHQDVHQGWQETKKHIRDAGNVIVVLKGLPVISQRMFPEQSKSSEWRGGRDEQTSAAKVLALLVTTSLKNGDFRCLMVVDEQEKKRLHKDFKSLFTMVQAPNMTTDEQEKMCVRLFSAPDIVQSLPDKDIQELFMRMKPVLDVTSFAPSEILFEIQDAQRTWEQNWRHTEGPGKEQLEKAESRLEEAQHLKEQLLTKLWEQRRAKKEQPLSLLQAVVMLEKILLPLYAQTVADLKKDLPSSEQVLVTALQKEFGRLFGACTKEEEERLLALPGLLKQKIKGQDLAVEAIGRALHRWRKVPPIDGKPNVLFFAGPSGVGKSETATQIAYHLNYVFGISESAEKTQEKNIYRIPLNRDKSGGFLGWNINKTLIVSFIKENPTCVIVFEEWDKMPNIEKASLLELLDSSPTYLEGEYTRNDKRPFADKRCITFLITANTASKELSEPVSGDVQVLFTQDIALIKQKILEVMKEREGDGPAFLSRIDGTIPFRSLTQDASAHLINTCLDIYVSQKVLKPSQVEAVRVKIAQLIEAMTEKPDARKLQDEIREAIFQVITEISN